MPRIEHRIVGEYHVFTSPDVPGLYVANRDEATARAGVRPTIEGLAAMAERRRNRDALLDRTAK